MIKVQRDIIRIDEDKCNGCGLCVPACKEGALKIIDGKARLVSEVYCDGLGACLGECPQGAITIDKREAMPFDEKTVEKHMNARTELSNWPVQLMLVPPEAPYLKNADIVFFADCTAYAYADIHKDLIRNRVAIIACPKLDDTEYYLKKLTQMIGLNNFRTIEIVMMEVPCCSGLARLVEGAAKDAGVDIKIKKIIITLNGERREI